MEIGKFSTIGDGRKLHNNLLVYHSVDSSTRQIPAGLALLLACKQTSASIATS
jgi:hypothetical protein